MSGGVNERVQELLIIQCTRMSRVAMQICTVSSCTGQVRVREKQLASTAFLLHLMRHVFLCGVMRCADLTRHAFLHKVMRKGVLLQLRRCRCSLHAEGRLQVIIVEECYRVGMLLIARAGEAR